MKKILQDFKGDLAKNQNKKLKRKDMYNVIYSLYEENKMFNDKKKIIICIAAILVIIVLFMIFVINRNKNKNIIFVFFLLLYKFCRKKYSRAKILMLIICALRVRKFFKKSKVSILNNNENR